MNEIIEVPRIKCNMRAIGACSVAYRPVVWYVASDVGFVYFGCIAHL